MKIFTRRLSLLFILFGLVFWANTFAQSSNLWNIQMNFCNNNQRTNEVDFISKAGKWFPICIEFMNVSNKKLTVNVEFVDAIITDDGFKKRACNAPDRTKEQFANFIQEYSNTIVLESWSSIKKNYIINFPVWFEGLSHWCMLYNIVEDIPQVENSLGIIVRSAKFIDMFVTTTNPITTTKISSSPTIIKKWKKYIVRLWIINKGNVDENIVIEWTVINILGFQKEFKFEEILGANTGKIFESDPFILPFYKWPFLITTKIGYQPQFNFNLTDGKNPSQNIQGWIITKKNIIMIRNIWFGIIAGIVLFSIVRNIFKKKLKK